MGSKIMQIASVEFFSGPTVTSSHLGPNIAQRIYIFTFDMELNVNPW